MAAMSNGYWDRKASNASMVIGSPIPSQSNGGSWSSGTTITFNVRVPPGGGSDTFTAIGVSLYNVGGARSVTSATLNGVAMTVIDTISATLEGNNQQFETWGVKGIAAGVQSCVVNFSASVGFIEVQALSFTGIDQTTPIDSHAIGQNTSSAGGASQATTVVSSSAVLLGFVYARIPTTIRGGAVGRTPTEFSQKDASANSQGSGFYADGVVPTGSQSVSFDYAGTSSTTPGIAAISLLKKTADSLRLDCIAVTTGGTNPGAVSNKSVTKPSYWEVTVDTLTTNFVIGIANRSWNTASGTILGGDANGLGYFQDGTVKRNNSTITTIMTFTTADVIQVAVRPADNTIFFKKNNAGNWNNAGGADPATNTGGIDISGLTWGALLAAFGGTVTTNIAIAAFSASEWQYSAPSGFSSIDAPVDATVPVGKIDATPMTVGPARTDQISQAEVTSCYPQTAAGAWYGYAKNDPTTRVAFWGPAATQTNISGTVTINGSPAAKKVKLYDQDTGEYLGEALSNAGTGAYTIPALGRSKVYVVATDETITYDALVFDEVTPV